MIELDRKKKDSLSPLFLTKESTLAKVQIKEAEKPQSNMEMTQEQQDDNEDTHDKASTSHHLHDVRK